MCRADENSYHCTPSGLWVPMSRSLHGLQTFLPSCLQGSLPGDPVLLKWKVVSTFLDSTLSWVGIPGSPLSSLSMTRISSLPLS